jgi:hypothetical protein
MQVAGVGATFTGAKYTIGFTASHLRHVIVGKACILILLVLR